MPLASMVSYFKNLHTDLNDVVKLVQNIIAKTTKVQARNIAMAAGDKITSTVKEVASVFAPQAYAFAA